MKLLGFLVSGLLSGMSFAHNADYISQTDEFGKVIYEKVVVRFEVLHPDVGLPGSYFIGIEGDHGNYYVHNKNGWGLFQGGIPDSYLDSPALSDNLSVVLFETPPSGQVSGQTICDRLREETGSSQVSIWIGYGALQPEAADRVNRYHSIANQRLDPNHVRHVYIFNDATTGSKGANVLSFNCPPIGPSTN